MLNKKPTTKYSQPSYKYPLNVGQVGQEPYMLFDIRDSIIQGAPPKGFITLYMPATISVRYAANYQELSDWSSFSTNSGFGDFGASIDTWSKAGQGLMDLGEFVGHSILGGSARAQAEFQGKKLINPHMTQAFTGMSFRQFNFEFNMLAKNKQESEQINNIIYTFKLHMHPNVKDSSGDTSRFFTYPEQFVIGLFSPNDKYLFKISKCVLTEMNVNYAGSGVPTFFDETGAPVDVRMSLTFNELLPMNKSNIEKGA